MFYLPIYMYLATYLYTYSFTCMYTYICVHTTCIYNIFMRFCICTIFEYTYTQLIDHRFE
jgi:hypothetical protein